MWLFYTQKSRLWWLRDALVVNAGREMKILIARSCDACSSRKPFTHEHTLRPQAPQVVADEFYVFCASFTWFTLHLRAGYCAILAPKVTLRQGKVMRIAGYSRTYLFAIIFYFTRLTITWWMENVIWLRLLSVFIVVLRDNNTLICSKYL